MLGWVVAEPGCRLTELSLNRVLHKPTAFGSTLSGSIAKPPSPVELGEVQQGHAAPAAIIHPTGTLLTCPR